MGSWPHADCTVRTALAAFFDIAKVGNIFEVSMAICLDRTVTSSEKRHWHVERNHFHTCWHPLRVNGLCYDLSLLYSKCLPGCGVDVSLTHPGHAGTQQFLIGKWPPAGLLWLCPETLGERKGVRKTRNESRNCRCQGRPAPPGWLDTYLYTLLLTEPTICFVGS